MARKRRDLLAHRDVWTFAAAGLWVLQCVRFRHYRLDDSYIAYRYAQHLAEGLGPVMNAGERVEGISNLPWTALLGLLGAIGLEPPAVAPVLSLLCGFGCIALVADLTSRLLEDRRAGGFAALLFAASAPVAVWSVSGMETLGFTLLLLLSMIHATQDRSGKRGGLRTGFWIGGAASLRPEGIAYAVPLLLGAHRGRRWIGRFLLGGLCIVGPLVLFRLLYYGDWLPNPVRAKAVFGAPTLLSGVLYVLAAGIAYPLLFASLLVLSRMPRFRWLLGGWMLTTVAVAIVAGGERIPAFRLLLPAWPVLAFCGEASLRQLRLIPGASRRRLLPAMMLLGGVGSWLLIWPHGASALGEAVLQRARLVGTAAAHAPRLLAEIRFLGGMVLIGASAGFLYLFLRTGMQQVETVEGGRHGGHEMGPGRLIHENLRSRRAVGIMGSACLAITLLPSFVAPSVRVCVQPDPAVRFGLPVGSWLRRNVTPGTLVATNCAGSLAYESGLPILDMLGLTDSHIARTRGDASRWVGHAKGDAAYVLARRPGIIVFGGPEGSVQPWPFPGERAIFEDSGFRRDYVLQRVPLQGFDFTYYQLRDSTRAGDAPTPP